MLATWLHSGRKVAAVVRCEGPRQRCTGTVADVLKKRPAASSRFVLQVVSERVTQKQDLCARYQPVLLVFIIFSSWWLAPGHPWLARSLAPSLSLSLSLPPSLSLSLVGIPAMWLRPSCAKANTSL